MQKHLRAKAVALLSEQMTKAFPDFIQVKMKSVYIWPGEVLWRKDAEDCSYFVVLSPEAKGRDEVTVELAWSRLKRFPELMQRPALVTADAIANAEEKDEGTVRLGMLAREHWGWVPVNDESISDVVAFFMAKLRKDGIPFLSRI